MAHDQRGPADTNMMRIVHNALRRDLRRARTVLLADPPPDDHQRGAIAEHLASSCSPTAQRVMNDDIGWTYE